MSAMVRFAGVGTAGVLMVLFASVALAERRCGWLDNPATGKWTLYDADGGKQVMFAGGDGTRAGGMDKIPDLTKGEYVRTFAIHGYACVCMDVDTDEESVTEIRRVRQLPLAKCRADPAIQYFLEGKGQ
jgi:hypothetical protein